MISMKIRQTHARTYAKCERKYKFQVIDKLVPNAKKSALSIGTACHAGRAQWLRTHDASESIYAAIASLQAELTNFLSLSEVPHVDKAGCECFECAKRIVGEVIASYCATFYTRFPTGTLQILGVEIPIESKIAEHDGLEMWIVGTADADAIWSDKYRVNFEYKTTRKQLATFFDEEYLSIQHKTYPYLLTQLNHEQYHGTIVDASRKPLVREGPVHDHIILPVGAEDTSEMLRDYKELLKRIAYSIDNEYFPPNFDSCFTNHGRCEYYPICKSRMDWRIVRDSYTVVDDSKQLAEEDEGAAR